ncbi:hypothetical protein EWM64_g201 [Hericium alpestre]|uniref:Uncharacterized protein n=1 Tax=Hericium alpestre TaxID=135208 RepID=A0A4Z0ABR0_9AGAM|nr:hypothetical protein EWM64_g201 [Hericium alpestre]
MCYAYGSIDQATGVCPMCKVFKPSSARCPHKQDVCHNRALHPRHDVVYLKNAEVQTFNGCGYCKWARTNPPQKAAGYQNPGWPGCCRPPSSSESKFIPPADWTAVASVHHIPIPSEVKALLESISTAASSRGSPAFGHSANVAKSNTAPPQAPALDRRSSAGIVPTKGMVTPARTQPLTIPAKARSGGSPKEVSNALISTTPRPSGAKGSPPPSNISPIEQGHSHRRAANVEHAEKLADSPNTPSPLRLSVVKVTTTAAKTSAETGPSLRRRASVAETTSFVGNAATQAASNRAPDRSNTISAPRSRAKRSSLDIDFAAMSVSGSSSNGGSSDSRSDAQSYVGSDGTVTSDGGFTDYLSDESEAELQRQAERQAALLAQHQMEEQEFKAARQQLAGVDLRPPKSWNPNTNQNTPRSQATQAHSYSTPVTAPAYSTQPRGQVDAVGLGRAR